MVLIKDIIRASDIKCVAERLLEKNGDGQDIILDGFGSFTSVKPILGDPPAEVVAAVSAWIGQSQVWSPSED